MTDDLNRVVPLNELPDFEVAPGDPDVRGWEVVASDGRTIGRVDQLLIDTQAMKVRYLDVDLERQAGVHDQRHILLPIGYARLHQEADRVLVDALQSGQIDSIPDYRPGEVTSDYESSLARSYDPSYEADPGDRYRHRVYDDTAFLGPRRR